MPRRSSKRTSRSPCRYGRKKSLRRGCKSKPGPKRSRRRCSRGLRKRSRVCKRKPGPKKSKSPRRRSAAKRA